MGFKSLTTEEEAFLAYSSISRRAAWGNFGFIDSLILTVSIKKKLGVKSIREALQLQKRFILENVPERLTTK